MGGIGGFALNFPPGSLCVIIQVALRSFLEDDWIMLMKDTLDQYFQELEAQHKFSGVALITRGQEQLYAGALGFLAPGPRA
jgi:hypothetical protein